MPPKNERIFQPVTISTCCEAISLIWLRHCTPLVRNSCATKSLKYMPGAQPVKDSCSRHRQSFFHGNSALVLMTLDLIGARAIEATTWRLTESCTSNLGTCRQADGFSGWAARLIRSPDKTPRLILSELIQASPPILDQAVDCSAIC